jgi:hypothetical protein
VSRILRIELRRSAAAGAALVLLLAGTVLLYSARESWAAGWMPLAMVQRQFLLLLWPLALAAGAWQARREQRSGVAELFASTARPLVQRVVPTLAALAIGVVCGYVAMAAAAVPWIAGTVDYVPAAGFAVLAVGALSLVAAAWLGLAAGRLVPSPVTAPAVAVAGIGLLLVLTPNVLGHREWLAALLSPTRGLGLFADFRTVSGRVSAAQGIWLAALAAAAVVLVAAGNRRYRAAAVLPPLLGVAVGFAVMPRGADFVESPIDATARQLVCAGTAPRVCISRMHAGLLPEVAPLARQGLARLAKLPGAPTTAAENVNTFLDEHAQPYRADTVLFRVEVGADGHLAERDQFLPRMLDAAGVSADACPAGHDRAVSRAAAYWLLDREPTDDRDGTAEANNEARALWQELRRLPAGEAAARVAAVRAAALSCQDLAGLLSGGTP